MEQTSNSKDLSRYKDIHAGERCFLMGTGPSLNKMNLEKLKDEFVIACNAIFLLFDRISWRPKYYAANDSRVIADRAEEFIRLAADYPEITLFLPSVLYLHDGSDAVVNTRAIVPPAPNIEFFELVPQQFYNHPYTAFSTDLTEGLVLPHTVLITMLQLAYYMGFREIYLIGCDTTFVVSPTVIQEEGPEITPGVKLLMTSTEDDDPNHFDPRYFGKGRKWHSSNLENMIKHYTWSKQVLEERGVRVFNATVGGNLEVFKRVDYDSLFGVRKWLSFR